MYSLGYTYIITIGSDLCKNYARITWYLPCHTTIPDACVICTI